MHFQPDEDQHAYTATVRRVLSDTDALKTARAWADGDQKPARALWHSLAGTGLVALAVPENHDGMGLHAAELASAFIEVGRSGAPGPLVETVALAAALTSATSSATAGTPMPWTAPALAGDALLTVTDPAGPYALDAREADAAFVLDADGGLHLAAPDGEPQTSIDPARHLSRCIAAEPVPADTGLLRALATLLTAAQALGAGRALLDGSVEYVGGRTQFGRPVGSFQAVKHHLADVAVALEFAEPLLYGAAVAVDRGDPASRDLPAAKAACSDAAFTAARKALQVHGALGYTDELDLTLLIRKTRSLRSAWGTPAACRAAVLPS